MLKSMSELLKVLIGRGRGEIRKKKKRTFREKGIKLNSGIN